MNEYKILKKYSFTYINLKYSTLTSISNKEY